MNEVTTWLISVMVVTLLIAAVIYAGGLVRLPVTERPRTPSYDRYGQYLGMSENPDYHINPGEEHEDDPD